MATSLHHTARSGWFPFDIADADKFSLGFGTSSLAVAAPVNGLSLPSLTRAFWYGKSFDYNIDMAWSLTRKNAPGATTGGVGPGVGSGTVTGAGTIDLSSFPVGGRAYNSTAAQGFPGNPQTNVLGPVDWVWSYVYERGNPPEGGSGTNVVGAAFQWFLPIAIASGWYGPNAWMIKSGASYLTNAYFGCSLGAVFTILGPGAEAGQFGRYVDPTDFANNPVVGNFDIIVAGETFSLPLRGRPSEFGDYDDGLGNSQVSTMTCNASVNFNNFF